MSVRQINDGRWVVDIRNGRKGKRIQKRLPKNVKTRLEALNYEKQIKILMKGVDKENIDLDHEIFTEAVEYYNEHSNKSTAREMQSVASLFIDLLNKHGYLPVFALSPPAEIFIRYADERKRIVSPGRVNRELLLFKKMHDYWVSRKYCLPLEFDLTTFYVKDKKNHVEFSEHFFEQLIEKYPHTFLDEKLISVKPPATKGYIPDSLLLDESGNYVVVEIQKERLDRIHAYKILEYRDKLEVKMSGKTIRMMEVIIGNSVPADRDVYLKKYGVELKVLPLKEIEQKILMLLE